MAIVWKEIGSGEYKVRFNGRGTDLGGVTIDKDCVIVASCFNGSPSISLVNSEGTEKSTLSTAKIYSPKDRTIYITESVYLLKTNGKTVTFNDTTESTLVTIIFV